MKNPYFPIFLFLYSVLVCLCSIHVDFLAIVENEKFNICLALSYLFCPRQSRIHFFQGTEIGEFSKFLVII